MQFSLEVLSILSYPNLSKPYWETGPDGQKQLKYDPTENSCAPIEFVGEFATFEEVKAEWLHIWKCASEHYSQDPELNWTVCPLILALPDSPDEPIPPNFY